MPKRSPENQEVVRLLSKLKEETPDYPADLLEARKYSYLKQVVDLKISADSHARERKTGGKGGGGGVGGAGSALRGGATILGIPLKTALAIGAAILLLTAGYLFRDQIAEFLAESGFIRTEETAAPPFAPTPAGPAVGTPATSAAPSTGGPATQSAPGAGDNGPGGTPTPPEQGGPVNIFQYLICVLQSDAQSCK